MLKVLILVIQVMTALDATNILAVFPTASISHQLPLRAMTNALEDKGHKLTIISTSPELGRHHANTTEIDLNFTYDLFRKEFKFAKITNSRNDRLGLLESLIPLLKSMYKKQFAHPDVQKLIQSRDQVKFDVIIVEYLMYWPWFALGEWFNAPLIGITSLDIMPELHAAHGNLAHPIIHPDFNLPFLECSSIQQRYQAWRLYFWTKFYYIPLMQPDIDDVIDKYMPGSEKNIEKLSRKASLLMTNTNPALGFIRPILPTTIQLGFMHIKPPKPITDEKLRNYLDHSDKPVIYMSLGSNVESSRLGENIVNNFLNVFKTLPFNVVWKWEANTMANKPDNVFIQKWLPQADLLTHPKIKMFITQGGQQSMEEAIDRGVPLIVIPFYGDQYSNAQRIVKLKIGFHVDLHSMTEESLRHAIGEVVNGDYKNNILKLRTLVYDQPMKPVKRAVWWVEYVIRNKGTEHLEYAGKDFPLYQQYMLDFIGIFLVSGFLIFAILFLVFKLAFKGKKSKTE